MEAEEKYCGKSTPQILYPFVLYSSSLTLEIAVDRLKYLNHYWMDGPEMFEIFMVFR